MWDMTAEPAHWKCGRWGRPGAHPGPITCWVSPSQRLDFSDFSVLAHKMGTNLKSYECNVCKTSGLRSLVPSRSSAEYLSSQLPSFPIRQEQVNWIGALTPREPH